LIRKDPSSITIRKKMTEKINLCLRTEREQLYKFKLAQAEIAIKENGDMGKLSMKALSQK
jgi:hypothetical protein